MCFSVLLKSCILIILFVPHIAMYQCGLSEIKLLDGAPEGSVLSRHISRQNYEPNNFQQTTNQITPIYLAWSPDRNSAVFNVLYT